MLFFKVEAKFVAGVEREEKEKETKRDEDEDGYVIKRDGHSGKCGNVYYFLSGIDDEIVEGGMILLNENENGRVNAVFPWNYVGMQVKDEVITEVTSAGFCEELDKLGARLRLKYPDIDLIVRRMRHSLDFDDGGILSGESFYSEDVVELVSKEDCMEYLKKNLWSEELCDEFERIYSPSNSHEFKGHPVHYLLRSDNFDAREETAKKLVAALWQNGRLESRRLGTISVSNVSERALRYLDELYSCYMGGAICLRFRNIHICNEFTSSVDETVEKLCGLIKAYKNKVLTIFCFPLAAEKEKAMFFDKLVGLSVCEFNDTFVEGERAREYVKGLAKEGGAEADDVLEGSIAEGKTYRVEELKRIFDDWYADMLKRKVYPVYSEVKCIGAAKAEKKIEGRAYDKLMSMVGLAEVKTLIRQAVNYYKAAKIFSAKGMGGKRLAMNMVFSGNPGTAKTTVARLFAEIMRDNGVLPSGHLVEVGRDGLVGRYVGHTAPLVKQQFASAKGGVLFIDEAYSLVDDRVGSFGDEAISAIVQEMENNREDTAVIFAGYTDKMQTFIKRNPGLKSRIAFNVEFSDYSVEELMEITRNMSGDYGVAFTAEALEKLRAIYAENCGSVDFGNGRFVRNMIEKAKFAQADRLKSRGYENVSEKDISTITAEDIVAYAPANHKFGLGFGA